MARKAPSKVPNPIRSIRRDLDAVADELVQFAQVRAKSAGKVALREYKAFREKHLKSHVPGALQILDVAPPKMRPAVRAADAWIRDAALQLEKGAAKILSR